MISTKKMLQVIVNRDGNLVLMYFPDWEAFYAFVWFFYDIREHMWNVDKDVEFDAYGIRTESLWSNTHEVKISVTVPESLS